jgi:hypothetical protein
MNFPRRLFVGRLLLGAAAAVVWCRDQIKSALLPQLDDQLPLAARHLAGLSTAPESAAAIGQEYLLGSPGEASLDFLVRTIASALGGTPNQVARIARRELRARYQSRQRSDFAEGHMVSVQGWFLSQTEARLCALVALVEGREPGSTG